MRMHLQAHEAHESMMAWRAAEVVRDLDGTAASIAAGQAEVWPAVLLRLCSSAGASTAVLLTVSSMSPGEESPADVTGAASCTLFGGLPRACALQCAKAAPMLCEVFPLVAQHILFRCAVCPR